jgi:hypothetical protein
MVKVSTLFHRVDGFDESETSSENPESLDLDFGDQFLQKLMEPLIFDPGEQLVKAILKKI